MTPSTGEIEAARADFDAALQAIGVGSCDRETAARVLATAPDIKADRRGSQA